MWLIHVETESTKIRIRGHSLITLVSPNLIFRVEGEEKKIMIPPNFPYFLPSPFLTCCSLPTLFGGKGAHLRRCLVAQPLAEIFRDFPQI